MWKEITWIEKHQCTGCGGCVNSCTKGAIKMYPDTKGFLYPMIHTDLCVNCGACERACTAGKQRESCGEGELYSAWLLDREKRFFSTSGGIFYALANNMLERHGKVVGAAYREDFSVRHQMIEDIRELPALMQSKYVQSETGDSFLQVKKELQKGTQVLFAGTPCQCAALHHYVGEYRENLLLCDFICRGVNAPRAYRAYLQELEERFGSRIVRVWFKHKRDGWNRFGTKITFESGEEYFSSRDEDAFMYGFIKKELNLYLRPSCNACEYKGCGGASDLTLGDFWGQRPKEGEEDLGISAVLLHTEKGTKEFLSLKNIHAEAKDRELLLKHNACLERSAKESKEADFFWKKLEEGIAFSEIIDRLKNKYETGR